MCDSGSQEVVVYPMLVTKDSQLPNQVYIFPK